MTIISLYIQSIRHDMVSDDFKYVLIQIYIYIQNKVFVNLII